MTYLEMYTPGKSPWYRLLEENGETPDTFFRGITDNQEVLQKVIGRGRLRVKFEDDSIVLQGVGLDLTLNGNHIGSLAVVLEVDENTRAHLIQIGPLNIILHVQTCQ